MAPKKQKRSVGKHASEHQRGSRKRKPSSRAHTLTRDASTGPSDPRKSRMCTRNSTRNGPNNTRTRRNQPHAHVHHKPSHPTRVGEIYDPNSLCEEALRSVYPSLRVYPIPSHMTRALVTKFNQQISHSRRQPPVREEGCDNDSAPPAEKKGSVEDPPSKPLPDITYFQLFRTFSGHDHQKNRPHLVLLKGGCVRDVLQGVAPSAVNDIDIIHTMPFSKARFGVPYGLNAQNIQYYESHSATHKYIKVGQQRDSATDTEPVDCVAETHFPPLEKYEAPVNTLFINVTHGRRNARQVMQPELDRVYDITGKGMDHLKQHVWGAPTQEVLQHPHWLSNAMLWRMLKFAIRGYRVSTRTKLALYRHWLGHYKTFSQNSFHFVWRDPWRHFLRPGDLVKESSAHERVERALDNMIEAVGADLDQLQELGHGATSASRFCRMLLECNVITSPGQFALLREIGKQARSLQAQAKRHRGDGTTGSQVSSSSNQSAHATQNKLLDCTKALILQTFKKTSFELPDVHTRLCSAPQEPLPPSPPEMEPNQTDCDKCTLVLPSEPAQLVATHPDTIRACAYLDAFAAEHTGERDGARLVLERLRLLVDTRLLTTYPMRSWSSDLRVPLDFKYSPTPFGFPQIRSSGRGLEFPLERGIWNALHIFLSDTQVERVSCAMMTPPKKTNTSSVLPVLPRPCNLWRWLCALSKKGFGVWVEGPFVHRLVQSGAPQSTLQDMHVVLIPDTDVSTNTAAGGMWDVQLRPCQSTSSDTLDVTPRNMRLRMCSETSLLSSEQKSAGAGVLYIDMQRRCVVDPSPDGTHMVASRRLDTHTP
jgi:hypothetical protein